MSNLRKQWNDTCKAAGIASIKKNTAAQILAIIYILGGEREIFTHNEKLKADIEYIQEVYGFQDGEVPNKEVADLFRKYVVELDFFTPSINQWYPQWAINLMKDNYNIKL